MGESRFDVRSPDGTSIVVWVDGEGPPLVMVHGSIADHTTFESLIAVLRDHLTIYALDRRGFGASGDTPPYSLDREAEDVVAAIDAVVERSGGPVTVWGHSYGANVAMAGTALAGDRVHHLVLYEPSLGIPYPSGSIEGVEAALEIGDNEATIVRVLTDILEMTDDEIDVFRQSPLWPTRLAAAPTVPRECHVEEDWVYEPGQFDGITAPTLLLSGSKSVGVVLDATRAAAKAIPYARIHVLAGHAHFAHRTDPEFVTQVILDFLPT